MKFKRLNMNSVVKILGRLTIMIEKLRRQMILIFKMILGQVLRRAIMK